MSPTDLYTGTCMVSDAYVNCIGFVHKMLLCFSDYHRGAHEIVNGWRDHDKERIPSIFRGQISQELFELFKIDHDST